VDREAFELVHGQDLAKEIEHGELTKVRVAQLVAGVVTVFRRCVHYRRRGASAQAARADKAEQPEERLEVVDMVIRDLFFRFWSSVRRIQIVARVSLLATTPQGLHLYATFFTTRSPHGISIDYLRTLEYQRSLYDYVTRNADTVRGDSQYEDYPREVDVSLSRPRARN
jgi:hypothetical protein